MSDSNLNHNNGVFFSSDGRGAPERVIMPDHTDHADYVVIAPECIIWADGGVISYKGENYYRACDELVSDLPDGGQSFCVKRVNHPGNLHEDYSGIVRVV